MLRFEFNADAYKQSVSRELIPEGQYRAKITSLDVTNMQDGTCKLVIGFQVTWHNAQFKDSLFLNPPSHPYFQSSNKRFGDLCVSCKVNPFQVQQDENILIGCTCGIELVHKKSKDGNSQFNTVKKFLSPNETDRLKEFSSSEQSQAPVTESFSSKSEDTALDPNNPASWFSA